MLKKLFKPSVDLANRLKYPQKLILLCTIVLFIVILLTYQTVNQSLDVMQFSQKELVGVQFNEPLRKVLQKIQEYRNIEYRYLLGDQGLKDTLPNARQEVEQAIDAMQEETLESSKILHTTDLWGKIKDDWASTQSQELPEGAQPNLTQYNNIINNIQDLIITACDNSNLTLDPDIDSYYLMDTYCTRMPGYSEQVSRIHDITLGIYTHKVRSDEDNKNLISLKTLLDKVSGPALQNNIKKVIDANQKLQMVLNVDRIKVASETSDFVKTLDKTLTANDFSKFPEGLQDEFIGLTNIINKLYSKTAQSLTDLLQIRVEKFKQTLYLNIASVIISLFLFIYLFIGLYLSVINSIKSLKDGSNRIAKGDLTGVVTLESRDELSEIGSSFNYMREMLFNIVSELREVVTGAIHGDLHKRIEVSGKEGVAKELAATMNQMSDIFQNIIIDVTTVLDVLSKGDLTKNISRDYEGMFNNLKSDVNSTVKGLEQLITAIKQTNTKISDAAEEIAIGNKDLAQRTDQQAAALEETSSSMEQITSTVKRNTENAKKANELAHLASDVAIRGGEVVSQVVSTIKIINESSQQATDIITVIDSIASQTNMLALNAAVEAARAGEQGRGFSVVASEVRNLSQRTSAAAKEISKLINTSVDNIIKGTDLVDEAGKTMSEIVNSVKNVTEIMNEIVNASVEQTNGIEQINIAINRMDHVTQQNNALVAQVANTAQSLETQMIHMNELVNIFKLSDTTQTNFGNELNTRIENTLKSKKKPGLKDIKSKIEKDEWREF